MQSVVVDSVGGYRPWVRPVREPEDHHEVVQLERPFYITITKLTNHEKRVKRHHELGVWTYQAVGRTWKGWV